MFQYIALIVFSVLYECLWPSFLEKGMMTIGHFEISAENIGPVALKVAINPFMIGGLFCYVLSVSLWMVVLSCVEISFA